MKGWWADARVGESMSHGEEDNGNGRNLVLCFDGTNNEYDATNTNVVKMYQMLDRAAPNQLMYYQPGIGTLAPPGVWGKVKRQWVKFVDLLIAWLLRDHVLSGYRFLMRYYRPGDRIFLFGFSRGAYTARALAGMLYKVGLLSPGNEELLARAWHMFRHKTKDNDGEKTTRKAETRCPENLHAGAEMDCEERARVKPEGDCKRTDKNGEPKDPLSAGFRHTFSRYVPIHFMGLWDTVSSIGLIFDRMNLPYTTCNPAVKILRHAVALDEKRADFRQNLWDEDKDQESQDVLQVWFPGAHCDVGGGYREPEAGLSRIPLLWMVQEAEAAGVRFQAKSKEAILPERTMEQLLASHATAKLHNSLRRFWRLRELVPRRVWVKCPAPSRQWIRRWIVPRGSPRDVPNCSYIHASVRQRQILIRQHNERLEREMAKLEGQGKYGPGERKKLEDAMLPRYDPENLPREGRYRILV